MGPDPNSDLQAPSQPSGTGVPVYVMLPLDTVWLVAREGRSFSVREPPKPEDSCSFAATPPSPPRCNLLCDDHRDVLAPRPSFAPLTLQLYCIVSTLFWAAESASTLRNASCGPLATRGLLRSMSWKPS